MVPFGRTTSTKAVKSASYCCSTRETRGRQRPKPQPANNSPLSDHCIPELSTAVLFHTNNSKLSALTQVLMSHPRSTTSSSSNFQLIIDNALKVYQKRTKTDLLLHPLAAQLQTCQSPSDILAVLQGQVHGLDQSQSGDDRWTKWLDPTIHVLLTFSGAVGTVGLVRPGICVYPRSHAHIYLAGICTRDGDLRWSWCSSFSAYPRYPNVGSL